MITAKPVFRADIYIISEFRAFRNLLGFREAFYVVTFFRIFC